MSGHSKWANTKHRKAAKDAKRGKAFTKLIRELTIAARQGKDPAGNPRLRAAIDKAFENNMTKDTIQRAVDRGAGNADSENMEEQVYSGYGPGGVAVLVECITNNRNRTVSEVRHIFTKHGGHLGTSVEFLFSKYGKLTFTQNSEAIMEAALYAGAEDILTNERSINVITTPQAFSAIKDRLSSAGYMAESSEICMFPDTLVQVQQTDFLEELEDLDDVQKVYSNAVLILHS